MLKRGWLTLTFTLLTHDGKKLTTTFWLTCLLDIKRSTQKVGKQIISKKKIKYIKENVELGLGGHL